MRKQICRFTKVLLFPAIPLVWCELVLIGLVLEVGHTRRHHINMFMASYHFLADRGEEGQGQVQGAGEGKSDHITSTFLRAERFRQTYIEQVLSGSKRYRVSHNLKVWLSPRPFIKSRT